MVYFKPNRLLLSPCVVDVVYSSILPNIFNAKIRSMRAYKENEGQMLATPNLFNIIN